MSPEIQKFEAGDEYHHVRFRSPDEFETIRTPDWAANVAESVSSGSEVRMGKYEDDDWSVESVLIPKNIDEKLARSKAKKIVDKIES